MIVPVLVIHGQLQAAEEYLSKVVSNVGQAGGDIFKIFSPVVAALCGKTAGARWLVQQFFKIDSRKKSHSKFSTLVYIATGAR